MSELNPKYISYEQPHTWQNQFCRFEIILDYPAWSNIIIRVFITGRLESEGEKRHDDEQKRWSLGRGRGGREKDLEMLKS